MYYLYSLYNHRWFAVNFDLIVLGVDVDFADNKMYNAFNYRAVVWTDTLQFFLMLGAVLLVIVLGILNLNNPLDIWYAAERGERLIFFKLVF